MAKTPQGSQWQNRDQRLNDHEACLKDHAEHLERIMEHLGMSDQASRGFPDWLILQEKKQEELFEEALDRLSKELSDLNNQYELNSEQLSDAEWDRRKFLLDPKKEEIL